MSTRLLQFLSGILVLVGFAMLAAYVAYRHEGASGQQQGIDAFRAAQAARDSSLQSSAGSTDSATMAPPVLPPEESPGPQVVPGEPDIPGPRPVRQAPDRQDWSPARIAAFDALASDDAAAEAPEGLLRIPSIQLEVPVFSGTDDAALTRGAGHIDGTPEPGESGNVGIAAHRDGWFRALKDVQVGDVVELETLAGIREYRVTDLSIVEPDDIHVLDPTARDAVTLVTCYPFYFVGSAPQRYIVRAERD
jgi:sortase A